MKFKWFWFLVLLAIASCQMKNDKAATENNTTAVKNENSNSGTSEAALNERVRTYLQLNRELKFDTLMDYVYPGLFKLAPREQLEGILKSFFSTPGLEVQMDSLQLISIDPVTKFSKGEVSKFVYTLVTRMRFAEQQGQPPMTSENIRVIMNSLKRSLGTNDVTFNNQTKYFTARATKQALAIKDDVSGNEWKFMALENNQELRSVLPAELAQKYFPPKDAAAK